MAEHSAYGPTASEASQLQPLGAQFSEATGSPYQERFYSLDTITEQATVLETEGGALSQARSMRNNRSFSRVGAAESHACSRDAE